MMESRTVLVTGAARRLGAAIARRLAGDGHRVVIHYGTSREEAEALAAELNGTSVGGDLADLAGIDRLFGRACAAAGGPIDALVNSASAFAYDGPPRVDPALFARLAAVNAGAPVLLASALARQGIADGAVVNLLDQKLANLNPDFFSYTCAKAALAAATPMLAQALGPGIAVNAVSPGLTLPSADQTAAEFDEVASRNLLGRPVGAERVADAVAFLLTARGITGQTIHVDAGQRFVPSGRDVMFDRPPREAALG
jgi:NAD(P)-dependent dehydrogenase (short-subunit alcohol dehydrogenase family)